MRLSRGAIREYQVPPLLWLITPVFLVIVGCHAQKSEAVKLEILISDLNLEISMKNNTDQSLIVHDQLVGGPLAPPIILEIKERSGATVKRCGSIDYFEAERLVKVEPGATALLVLPASTISVTHCLKRGTEYRIRAGYVTPDNVANFSRWTRFRDDANLGGKDGGGT